ncbi:MAG: HAD-IIA family hydrolase [Cardiobacteriaceae bacterium]|nr:HAD-IIA family hydrolase [Cardiobacteriaceae bacterium]
MPALAAYNQLEAIRNRLPTFHPTGKAPQTTDNILSIAEYYDAYWFDAFGVLNVGGQAIAGAISAVEQLRARDKQVFVLSNAASVSKPNMVKRFAGLGFDFSAEEIVTSRDAVLNTLNAYPKEMLWGLIGLPHSQEDLQTQGIRFCHQDAADFFGAPDGYLFLATAHWNEQEQEKLLNALTARPRPIILGNPDLIAPIPDHISIEPGSYILTLPDQLFSHVHVCGKPYPDIFNIAAQRTAHFTPDRTLMCGDTLHTDILGGNAYGVQTALLTAHGFYRGLDYRHYIDDSGISPDIILPQL